MSDSSSSSVVKNLINELSNTTPSTTKPATTPSSSNVANKPVATTNEQNPSTTTSTTAQDASTADTNVNTTPAAAGTATASTSSSSSSNGSIAPLREDMVKQAVSFLTSPNVRSAEKEKKIAFLRNKGMNQAEIDESFKRAGDNTTAATTSTPNTATTTTPRSHDIPSSTTTATAIQQPQRPALAPVLPPRAYTQPQIVYYPLPPPPPVPTEKVFALAVMLGMGAVGATAGIIGLLRQFIAPIFNRIAEYQRTRYNQRREIADKLLESLKSFQTENDDLDALIDQGDEKTVSDALIKHQTELPTKLEALIATLKDRITTQFDKKYKPYQDLHVDIGGFRDTLTSSTSDSLSASSAYSYSPYYMRNSLNMDSPAVSGLKSDIRSLKAVLLNRRNFPTV